MPTSMYKEKRIFKTKINPYNLPLKLNLKLSFTLVLNLNQVLNLNLSFKPKLKTKIHWDYEVYTRANSSHKKKWLEKN